MNNTTKILGFTAGVALLFGAAFAVGNLVGPFKEDSHSDDGHGDSRESAKTETPGGLQISQDGYTLQLQHSPTQPAVSDDLRFAVLGPDNKPVTEFRNNHEKRLHLIVVRRDTSDFQHVHPTMTDDGTWSVPFATAAAGQYRMFADFQPADRDEGLTLGTDFAVAGTYTPIALPESSDTDDIDGFQVAISGTLASGQTSKITLEITQAGKPVTNLQPYLGAYGHLVALRAGDLAYLHVHPAGEPADGKTKPGPTIEFFAEVPSVGEYRLFLDFQHGDTVRTAEFTMTATTANDTAAADESGDHDSHG